MSEYTEEPIRKFLYDEDIEVALSLLTELIESLIIPSKMKASTIQALARILLLLRRMPYSTPSIDGNIGISLRVNEELSYCMLSVCEDELELNDGGSVYDPAIGSDSYSSTVFYMHIGGYINGSEYDIHDWIDSVKELIAFGANVSEDSINDTDDIDWDENPSKSKRYE